jgi:probable rRNA maturation factor
MISVKIASPQEILEPPYQQLRETAKKVLEGEKVLEAKISIALVDNATIHRLNKQFLDHDEPTDILTFPYSGPGAKKLEGELILGIEVAIEEAKVRGHTPETELCLYVIHGILHLCGYDDLTKKDAAEMRRMERHYLGICGLADVADKE